MDNRLQLLIDYYEEEQASILQSINECLKEDVDYLMAHQLSKALYKTKDKLRLFKYLADGLYDEKTVLLERIKKQEVWMESETRDYIKLHVAEMLEKSKALLEKLKQQHQAARRNEFAFDETLGKLISREIKYFNLILNKSKNLYLEFRMVKKEFKITIPNIKKLTESFLFSEYQTKAYMRLGFHFNKNSSKMVLLLPCKTEDGTQQMKIILSRLVFEVAQTGRGFGEVYIMYKS